MLASFELGIIVGSLGAICVAVTVFAIYRALSEDKPFSKLVSAILGLPIFYGGGSWFGGALIPDDQIQQNAAIYLLMIMITLLGINFYPCLRLVRWLNKNIDPSIHTKEGKRELA